MLNKMKKHSGKLVISTVLILSLIIFQSVRAASSISFSEIEVITLANTPSNLTLDKANTTDTSLAVRIESNGNPLNTKYTYEVSPDNINWTIVENQALDKLATNIGGLSGNQYYYVRVSSYNQDQPPISNGQYIIEQFLTKPSKPSTPTGSVDGQNITINWTNVSGTTTKLFDGSNQPIPIDAGSNSKELLDLTPDTQYTFYIVHENETGDSDKSDYFIIWTDAKPPTNLRQVTSTDTSITVQIDANGNPATTNYQYRITKKDGTPVAVSPWTTDTTYEFTSLDPGEYKIFAKSKNHPLNPNGKETEEIEILAGTIPAAPTITAETTETTLTAELTPVSDPSNVEFRIVLLNESGTEIDSTTWAKQGEDWATNGIKYTFKNLNPNKKYKVRGEARYAAFE
jgi:hypothetical protein